MKKALLVIGIFFLALIIIGILSGSFISNIFQPQGGVFRSVDAGDTWERSNVVLGQGEINSADILTLSFHPRDNRITYMGTRGDSLYKSLDAGKRWIKIDDESRVLSPQATVYDIALDPTRPDYQEQIPERLYAAVYQNGYGRILKSEDSAQSFREVYVTSDAEQPVFSLFIERGAPNSIWAGTGEGLLLHSTDFGESWEKIHEFPGAINAILPNPSNRNDIFVATFRDGIFRSFDRGSSWQDLTSQLSSFSRADAIEHAVRDPNRPFTLYLATWSGLLRSINGGTSWEMVNLIIPRDKLPVTHVAFSSALPSLLYVSANGNMYISNNRGEEWAVRKLPSSKAVQTIAIKSDQPSIVLIGMHE